MSMTEERYYGGSRDLSTAADTTIHPQVKRVTVVNATAGGVDLTLPDARRLRLSMPFFVINRGTVNGFNVRDNAGGLVSAVATQSVLYGRLAKNDTQAGTWAVKVKPLH